MLSKVNSIIVIYPLENVTYYLQFQQEPFTYYSIRFILSIRYKTIAVPWYKITILFTKAQLHNVNHANTIHKLLKNNLRAHTNKYIIHNKLESAHVGWICTISGEKCLLCSIYNLLYLVYLVVFILFKFNLYV